MTYSIGSDSINLKQLMYIAFVFLIMVGTLWYAANVPAVWEEARFYMLFFLTALSGFSISIAVMQFGYDFNIPKYGDPVLFPELIKKYMPLIAFVVFTVSFIFVGSTGYAVYSPSFKVVGAGQAGQALMTAFAAIAEDVLFFGVVTGVIFSAFKLYFKNTKIALLSVLLLVPTFFTGWHMLQYGVHQLPAMLATFVFGIEGIISVLVFENLLYIHARHVANNVGIFLLSGASLSTVFISVISSPIFWVITVLTIVLILVRRYVIPPAGEW